MPNYLKDFVGLNIIINDPIEIDNGSYDTNSNTFGVNPALDAQYFIHEGNTLPTSSILPLLNTQRNGPWGFNSWKQTRIGQNAISRYHRKHNIMSFVQQPLQMIISGGSQQETVILKNNRLFHRDEPPVINKHKPIIVTLGKTVFIEDQPVEKKLELAVSYNNENCYFSSEISNKSAKTDFQPKSKEYEAIKKLYLDGGLENEESPFDSFESLVFSQNIWPNETYTFKSYIRSRRFYNSKFWRDGRNERSQFVDNGFGRKVNQSMWPLDTARNKPADDVHILDDIHGADNNESNPTHDYGILQNKYNNFISSTQGFTGVILIKNRKKPAPLYAAKHTLVASASVVNPTSPLPALTGALKETSRFSGESYWDAPITANRNPFDDSIEDFAKEIKTRYKDYSIVPEFKMSDHVDFYINNSIKADRPNLLEMTGGFDGRRIQGPPSLAESAHNSSTDSFFEIYSNSDFLKNFDIIKEDHSDLADPSRITLKCKAVKKLVPYEGFYPAQRTVQMASQFFNEVLTNVKYKDPERAADATTNVTSSIMNLLQPLFAPGVLYNTIKSGVACDFMTLETTSSAFRFDRSQYLDGNGQVILGATQAQNIANEFAGDGSGDDFYINLSKSYYANDQGNKSFFRTTFESLINPEKVLANHVLFPTSIHLSGSRDSYFNGIVWNGKMGLLYERMMDNFLAETSDFFLEEKRNTVISSLPQGSPSFGNAKEGKAYTMRVKMFRSYDRPNFTLSSSHGDRQGFFPPNMVIVTGSNAGTRPKETFTMYSRPSAFGPPSAVMRESFFQLQPVGASPPHVKCLNSLDRTSCGVYGYNYPYTPPYYHGEAWADITFVAPETRKFTLAEIINRSTVVYKRHVPYLDTRRRNPESVTAAGDASGASAVVQQNFEKIVNQHAMQLSASVNLFEMDVLDQKDSKASSTSNQTVDLGARWIIQTKFETPMLNFNHITRDDITKTGYNDVDRQASIGMWHQLGVIPEPKDGVFLQVTDTPRSWLRETLGLSMANIKANYKSMVDLCGFDRRVRKLGKIDKSKTIKEAVVAIPFYSESGNKKFFTIPRSDIQNAMNPETHHLVGNSIIDMVNKMKQYKFPPSMDFLNYQSVDPISMYIFEFEAKLSQQDLSYIWQNLAPDISVTHEESQATISHQLLAHELLGEGSVLSDQGSEKVLDVIAKGTEFKSDIRWMVFKVKYKAKTRYFDKMYGKQAAKIKNENITYNWPYDFFSLVELAKIEAKVEISDIEVEEKTKIVKPKRIKSKRDFRKVNLRNPIRGFKPSGKK